MLQLPCESVPVTEDEMTYLDGGNIYHVFLYLLGSWMRRIVIDEAHSLISGIGSAGNLSPIKDWVENFFTQRSLGSQLMFIGGSFVLCKELWDRIK